MFSGASRTAAPMREHAAAASSRRGRSRRHGCTRRFFSTTLIQALTAAEVWRLQTATRSRAGLLLESTWRLTFHARRVAAAESEGRRRVRSSRRSATTSCASCRPARRSFPGIIGYDDTVIPQLVNAILSRHNFILLGLRGQAKSRILRGLVDLLDEQIPVVPGCEIHDDPLAPICAACRARVAREGDRHADRAGSPRDARFVEKLATPDVTIADMVGDIDPIKAAQAGLNLSDELTMHYGLLPRANRGIFAINELPDLAGKIQVGLFNILQEGDVQIKGYPIRLPLDVMLVFTANPEDYTARGKIITPLKDRIGSEIRTHYPTTRAATRWPSRQQEAWTDRAGAGSVSRSRATCARWSRRSRFRRAPTARSTSAPASASGLPITHARARGLERRAPRARQRRNARRAAGHRPVRRAAVDHRQVRAGV